MVLSLAGRGGEVTPRQMVAMRLPRRTIGQLKMLAQRYGSQANAVVELVDAAFGCPQCGNRDMDWLPIDEETDLVTCAKCGATYNPLEG